MDEMNMFRERCARAMKLYGACKTFDDFIGLQEQFIEGKLDTSICHFGPLYPETQAKYKQLLYLLHHGFITIDSQPSEEGGEFGYVSGFMKTDLAASIVPNKDVIMIIEAQMLIANGNARPRYAKRGKSFMCHVHPDCIDTAHFSEDKWSTIFERIFEHDQAEMGPWPLLDFLPRYIQDEIRRTHVYVEFFDVHINTDRDIIDRVKEVVETHIDKIDHRRKQKLCDYVAYLRKLYPEC